MESKFIKITNQNEWRDLLNKVLFKTFFHNIEWEEFLESQFKWLKFERYLWPVKGGQAILSLARVGGKLISHPFCEYGGPLPLVDKIDGKAFQRDLFEQFKAPFKISFHPQILNYFEGIEFPENERETYLFEDLHLQGETQLWDRMDRNRHRAIKSAENQGFQIKACQNLEELKKLYDFYFKNLKKHKAIPYPFSFFKFFFSSPKAEVIMVHRRGVIGGNIFLSCGKIIHSFLCGFTEIDKREGAHSLVLWEEIKKSKKGGYQAFDFGATRKDSSVQDFKERWGAKPYPIYELRNYSAQITLRKSKLRDIYGFLPDFLIKKFNHRLLKFKL